MITDITQYIVEWVLGWPDLTGDCILSENPEVDYKEGLHFGYKDPEKGILIKTSTEFTYSGLDDRRGNFFYLRHVDDEVLTYNPPEKRVTSCINDTQIAIPVRLVSVLRNIAVVTGLERIEVEEYLRNCLLNIDWSDYTGPEDNLEIELTAGCYNNLKILDEERGPKDTARSRGFELRNMFTTIDFLLKYTFHGEPKD